jgi:putative restriction endonuclease
MQPNKLREKLNSIKMWQRGGERAPHKPLLLLYALGRLTHGEPIAMA